MRAHRISSGASSASSLALAMGRGVVADPPEIFGTIRPQHVRSRIEPSAEGRAAEHVPRRQPEAVLRELDDREDDDGVVPDLVSSSAGGGVLGRLLEKLLGETRSTSGGPPGADGPMRWSPRGARSAPIGLATGSPSRTDHIAAIEQRGARYPEWDVYRRRYRRDWCTV